MNEKQKAWMELSEEMGDLTDESKKIEESEQRESDFFYRRSKNNTRNPFED